MNWEMFWTMMAVVVVYKVIEWVQDRWSYWQIKRDYGSIETILDRIEKDNY